MADALSRHLVSRAFLLQAAEMRFLVSLDFHTSAHVAATFALCSLITAGLHVVLLCHCVALVLRSLHCTC
jgi:hypothetical protein